MVKIVNCWWVKSKFFLDKRKIIDILKDYNNFAFYLVLYSEE